MRILMLMIGSATVFAASMAAGEESTHYMQTVRPLLRARCVACHGALRQEGGLRLDTGSAIRTGGDSGPAVMNGDANASLLIRRVEHADAEQRMPPEGERLNPEQIGALREWIAAGAISPSDEAPDPSPREHWAFRSPVRPELNDAEKLLHPIDALINRQLTQRELAVVPAADRRTLLRRVTFDLTGLPPTPEDQRAFCDDESEDAWERVVDRLLESPSYGERWARHWMDVWRYSDWYGRRSVPDVMNSYPTIWRWRDWIVRSLNRDKGYDQMVVEMLAGDEVAPDDLDTVAATGFVVRNWFKWNRDTWMRDQVEHTGKAFLGLWFQCALCHDHKYDPVSQREYFQLRAVFEPLELRHDRVPGEPDPGPHKAYVYGASYGPITSGMVRVFDHQPDAATRIYRGGDQRNIASDLEPVSAAIPEFLDRRAFEIQPIELPVTSWYPGLRDSVQAEEVAARQKAVDEALAEVKAVDQGDSTPVGNQVRTVASRKLDAARAELNSWVSRTAAERARCIDRSTDTTATATAAANAERSAAFQKALSQLAAAELDLLRAEALPDTDNARAEKIQKARAAVDTAKSAKAAAEETLKKTDPVYTPLSPVFISKSTGRRSALARWIVDRSNPLSARVAVNHIWNWHFGRPLVETTSNFGRNGKPPSHPELLDWLAVEFMENGWSQKHLHRLILTSEAWKRASSFAAGSEAQDSQSKDPENRYLWRANTRRMEAEAVRDSILFVSGQLDLTQGGPELDQSLGLSSRRRSLYFSHHGETKMQFLELFDAPSPLDCYRRTSSILPQQALALSNSELTEQQSRVLTGRLLETSGKDDLQLVRLAFEWILSRNPDERETEISLSFLERQRELYRSSTGADGQPIVSPETAELRSRESFVHAMLNHNDFLTIR